MASSRITGTNENIQTYGDGTRNFTSLATWEAATDNDLVTATTSEVLECYADSASYADTVVMANATTNSSYFRIIRPATGEGHNGTVSGVTFSSAAAQYVIHVQEDYGSIQDLCVKNTNNNAADTAAIKIDATGSSCIGCIVFDCANAGAGDAAGIDSSSAGGTDIVIVNCLVYGGQYGIAVGTSDAFVYNCTVHNCSITGYEVYANLLVAKNCLANACGTNYVTSAGSTIGSVSNASSDATVFGTGGYTAQSFTFANSATSNFHLHRNDLGAHYRGTNLSADATFPFDDDITGATITNWSIGFHAEETTQSSRRTGDNENVSTYAASGADYSSLSVWEAATDNDLVTGAVTEVLECAAGVYDDTVSLAGATTDGRYFRIIRPQSNAHHGGLTGAGVRFVATSALTSNCVLQINENFSSIQDVYVATTLTSASANFGVQTGGSADYATIVGCIALVGNVGAGGGNGFAHATSSDRCRIANCLALACKTAGFAANGTSVNMVWTGNTSTGSPTGFTKGAGASVIAQNCLAHNNATAGFTGTFATGTTNNASAAADAPGTNDRDSQTFTFVNTATSNFHLSASDAGAKGFGSNLSAGNWYNFTDDVDRVTISTWSIGFDSDPNHAKGKVGMIRRSSKVHGVLT